MDEQVWCARLGQCGAHQGTGAGRGTADQASSRGLTGLLRCASAPSSAGVGVTGHKEAWG